MAKTLVNIYPGLRASMSYNGDDTETLSKILNISGDTARRRLRGEREFDIGEILILTRRYGKTFEELFGRQEEKTGTI